MRIYIGHIATAKGQQRDELQHIAHPLQDGELPVGAVATAAHGPGDEGTRRTTRPEEDVRKSSAVTERFFANRGQIARK